MCRREKQTKRLRECKGTASVRRVCVAGAGSIGSLFAGHLAQVCDVTLLVRREAQAEALNREGLHISGRSDRQSIVTAATTPAELPEPDIVIVACKAADLENVAKILRGHWPGATVMTIQNGLGAEEIVAAYGGWPLLSSVTFMSGTRHSDTHVEYVLDSATWIGPFRNTSEADAQAVADLIVSSGLKAEAFADVRPAQWSKLIFTATVSTVAALTELPHDFHFAETERLSDLGSLVRDLIHEGQVVATAVGVELYEDPWKMNVLATQRGYKHYPSMLEDVEARRPTELELISGSLVRAALAHGVAIPLHTALYRLVKAKEASYS